MSEGRMSSKSRPFAMGLLFTVLSIGPGCSSDVRLVRSMVAPNGLWRADWYDRSAGGAADASTDEVRLTRSDGATSVVFEAAASDPIHIEWLDNTHLEIAYPREDSVLKADKSFGGIQLICREDLSLRRHQR